MTPSGSNDFHGEIFWFYRHDRFAANSFFNNLSGIEKPELVRKQIGFTLSGPIWRDKILLFGHYEGQRIQQGQSQNNLVLTPDARHGIFTYEDIAGNIRKLNVLEAAGVPKDPFMAALLKSVPTEVNNFLLGDSSAAVSKNNADTVLSRTLTTFGTRVASGSTLSPLTTTALRAFIPPFTI